MRKTKYEKILSKENASFLLHLLDRWWTRWRRCWDCNCGWSDRYNGRGLCLRHRALFPSFIGNIWICRKKVWTRIGYNSLHLIVKDRRISSNSKCIRTSGGRHQSHGSRDRLLITGEWFRHSIGDRSWASQLPTIYIPVQQLPPWGCRHCNVWWWDL